MVEDKISKVVRAAGEIFLRYGFARTTMGDVAKAAGISRPALYLLFPGKEPLFAAATMALAQQRLRDISAAADRCSDLEQRLATACEMLLISIFELQQSTPDALDMDDLQFPVVRDIYTMFEDYLAALIADDLPVTDWPTSDAARVLLYGARGLRKVAASADDYRTLIRLHVALLVRGMLAGTPRF
jgi:AcrR family transcriptional regulator